MQAVPRLFILYTGICLQLKKITENLRVPEMRSADPNTIHLVDLAMASDGLDWPAAPCHPWLSRQATGSTPG